MTSNRPDDGLLADVPAVVYEQTRQGTLEYISAHARRLLSLDIASQEPVDLWVHVEPADRAMRDRSVKRAFERGGALSCEYRVIDRHGRTRWLRDEAVVVTSDRGAVLRGIILDITQTKRVHANPTERLSRDRLTGLADRASFKAHVGEAVKAAAGTVALFLIDIDDFTFLNGSMGDALGDDALVAIAKRISSPVRGGTAARLGGDVFALLVQDMPCDDASAVADHIADTLLAPVMLRGRDISVTASIGIAVNNGTTTADDLLRNADLAMREAKRRGKNRWALYDPALRAAVSGRLELHADLEEALRNDDLTLHYQPIITLTDESVCGMEALARWRHPQHGWVSPTRFVPIAESSQLIMLLDEWVLEKACSQMAAWRSLYPAARDMYVSVNISSRHLAGANLPRYVDKLLHGCRLDPSALVIEITESSLIHDMEASIATMRTLRESGVRIALDDFGTGFSSLSYLHKMPVDILKIDRAFMTGYDAAVGPGLLEALIGLGTALNIRVVAEGVETTAQSQMLNGISCDAAQGFLFSRPRPALDISQLLISSGVAKTVRASEFATAGRQLARA